MKKKTILSIIISLSIILYSYTFFANNEIVGGVTGDAINGASNMAKDVANGVGEATGSVVNGVSNVAGDIGNGVQETAQDTGNYIRNIPNNSLTSSTTDEYNATAKNAGAPNTFLGMDSMTWWWIIIGAICALIVVLLWNKMSNNTENNE